MYFQEARLIHVELPLIAPFKTSYGELNSKDFYIIELVNEEGIRGYGELEAFPLPDYTEETLSTAISIVKQHLLPILAQKEIRTPQEINQMFSRFKEMKWRKRLWSLLFGMLLQKTRSSHWLK